jgi:D-beta-D-heptose 7-phosphate kinase/D-beta-D-heptose 1-phosphate adenosyltransferase
MRVECARGLLKKAKGRRVLLVGDLMMDEWVFGSVNRISPEAPIPVVTMPLTPEARAEKPGGAGNVAAVLLGLGASVRAVGVMGDDDYGRRLAGDLERRGADISGVIIDASRPTTHKLRIIASRQQLLRIDTEYDDAFEGAISSRLREAIRTGIEQADVVLVADYAKGVISEESLPIELIAAARESGIPFCADPKPCNIDLFRGASLVSPNESEALQAAGQHSNPPAAAGHAESPAGSEGTLPHDVVAAGRALRTRLEADAVFITRGDRGIAVFGPGEEVTDVPAARRSGDVGDGTGCGDAVSGVSALILAAGGDFIEAAETANAAGGVVSRFVGVHNPSSQEILDWLDQGL